MESIQIIGFDPNKTLTVDEDALRRILMKDEIRDKYICVVSITGVYRQGKSFLLNFFLRYLRVKYAEKRDVTNWLQPEDGPLLGFSWAAGSKRHTTGIHMWPEVFLARLPTGEEAAIILLDTQGSFDNQGTFNECSTIFTLSTLLSSVQIYNLMRGIKQYDLTHLQCFGGYGKLLVDSNEAPFQNLWFLVRDWACPYEKAYGTSGGAQLMEEVFGSADEVPELKAQVDNVKEVFEKISCFLLPYPGRTVDASASFLGELKDIDEIFLRQVQDFVETILAPEHLVLKTMHGSKIKAGDLIHYVVEYKEILKEDKLPKMETLFKATIEAHHKAAATRSFKFYKKAMDCDLKNSPKCYSDLELEHKHSITKLKAVDHYSRSKKIEDSEINDKYLLELKTKMDQEFLEYKRFNEKKIREKQEGHRKIQEQIDRVPRGSSGQGSSQSTLNVVEQVGTAVAVVGGIAAFAFGLSKLFGSSKGKSD